jgi:hypothetical protein
MDFVNTLIEYWPHILAALVGAAAVLKAVSKMTKTTKDDKISEIVDQAIDAVDGE